MSDLGKGMRLTGLAGAALLLGACAVGPDYRAPAPEVGASFDGRALVESQQAAPEARWIISDFTVPERGWRRLRARAIHALMYAFFRVTTRLPARHWTKPDPMLERAGFRLTGRRTTEWGLLQADLWRRPSA